MKFKTYLLDFSPGSQILFMVAVNWCHFGS